MGRLPSDNAGHLRTPLNRGGRVFTCTLNGTDRVLPRTQVYCCVWAYFFVQLLYPTTKNYLDLEPQLTALL